MNDFSTSKHAISRANRFALGTIVATPGAVEACARELLMRCLARHAQADWGCVSPDDAQENNLSVRDGRRLLSAYPIDASQPCKGFGDNCLWIITEADRSATTLLLPDEY